LAGSKYLSGNFVYISEEKASELGNANLKPGDLVFPHRGNIGAVGLVPDDGNRYVLSTSLMKITLDAGRALPAFYYYFFRSDHGQAELLKNASQVGTPGIATPLTSLRACIVPLPPIEQQAVVVAMLCSLDDRIELLRQTNATLESIAQTLFKSWFIDFGPTHAKAEGREPEGMDAVTAALFPSEFEKSELGLIPVGWRPGTLADLATLNAESWTTKRRPARLSYIDLSNVKDNRVDEVTEYEFNDAPSRARRVLHSGDTIVGTVRPGNRSFAYIQNAPDGLTASTGFAVLTANEKWCQEFVYLAMTRDENIARLANLADGGAYPAVRPELVVGTQAVLPTSKVLQAFSAVASLLFDRHAENRRIERSLADVRDALLPRLISGKLRIPEAQEQLEDAVA
jgi:type I restriction enzyme S subunit